MGKGKLTREERENFEAENLKRYACKSIDATRKDESHPRHPYRTRYERDIDRIIYSRAFRRLEYKTQVYMFGIDDHVRTRLTHSLEVSQIAENVAKTLGVNGDLARAIALGHDLGHAPFGHAGERELDTILRDRGCWGFRHNVQGVRIVDELESKYSHPGLNLTLDVREGILKHTSLPVEWGDGCLEECCRDLRPDVKHSVTVEGQIVAAVDEIAQRCHDLDDCWELGFINYEELKKLGIYQAIQEFYMSEDKYDMDAELRERGPRGQKGLFTRCLMRYLITDLIETSSANLTDELEARKIPKVVIHHSPKAENLIKAFKKHTFDELILGDPRVKGLDESAKVIICNLFKIFSEFTDLLSGSAQKRLHTAHSNIDKARVIADYVAGMTDRYAYEQFKGPHLFANRINT